MNEMIDQAFKNLGFSPFPGQKETVEEILNAYLHEGYTSVVLSAPTGTGKSIIGAVAAEVLALLTEEGQQESLITRASISCTATNVLAKQYEGTFSQIRQQDSKAHIMIKGANNYECSALSDGTSLENAESCAYYTMIRHQSEFGGIIAEHCDSGCEYMRMKRLKNAARHLTTNYSYFFVDRMYTGKFEDRCLLVWDEAHLVNELFSDHNAIIFSEKRIESFKKELAENIQLTSIEIMRNLNKILNACKNVKITETNYREWLNLLHQTYVDIHGEVSSHAEYAMKSGKDKVYTKLTKLANKYRGLGCKIDDLNKYEYPHIFEFKEEEFQVSVKPVFVGKMMDALQCGPLNLFMSATITKDFVTKTLNLDASTTKFIQVPSTFSKSNKKVVFFDSQQLSYTSLQNPDLVKKLRVNVKKIVQKHIESGERGIILAPSFKLQNEILSELNPLGIKIFEHRQGEKLEFILDAFKMHKGGPAILISPAMFEGVDLPGDLSRFQILVKAPYPSLGDKRVKYISEHHPDLYSLMTIMKAVQGAGRSVRSSSDYAVTYCLDYNMQRLWTSKQNIWNSEFETTFIKDFY